MTYLPAGLTSSRGYLKVIGVAEATTVEVASMAEGKHLHSHLVVQALELESSPMAAALTSSTACACFPKTPLPA
jgi:hypothetical protein